jgi:uncharacterized protein YdeI (BOF family)
MKRPSTNKTTLATAVVLASGLSASPLLAADHDPNPRSRPDGSWVSIGGTVTSVSASTFMLDFGDGMMTVEMDDWEGWGDAWSVSSGDQVTVYGSVDDDLYESAKIEAGAVFVEDLNTYFYASSADEEDFDASYGFTPVRAGSITIVGTVEQVMHDQGLFVVDSDLREMNVDVDPLLYDPLDEQGFQKIEVGDRVSITGDVDYEVLDGHELEATRVVTLDSAG